MAYDETPRKPIEVRDDRARNNHDANIDAAKRAGKHGVRTDAAAQGDGYLGMDDIDKMRRRKVR